MRFIRHISFLIALFVHMGHDVIAHIDESEVLEHFQNVAHNSLLTIPAQQEQEVLGHLFSHLQHGTFEHSVVDLGLSEKKGDSKINIFNALAYLHFADKPVWYFNYKKQHFPKIESHVTSRHLYAFSFRGPPAC